MRQIHQFKILVIESINFFEEVQMHICVKLCCFRPSLSFVVFHMTDRSYAKQRAARNFVNSIRNNRYDSLRSSVAGIKSDVMGTCVAPPIVQNCFSLSGKLNRNLFFDQFNKGKHNFNYCCSFGIGIVTRKRSLISC